MYELFCDGGARGNPGPAGAGVVIFYNREIVKEIALYLGETTNNVAEYSSLVAGLEYVAKQKNASSVLVKMDSELVVKQMLGEYKVRNANLKPLYTRASELAHTLPSVSFLHIGREYNQLADKLANRAMDAKKSVKM